MCGKFDNLWQMVQFQVKNLISKWPFKGGGSIRPNPEGRIIENRKAEFYWPLGQNSKAKFDPKAENISTLISAFYNNIFICYKTT